MFNVSQNNTNMPLGSSTGGFSVPGGVYNQFATPEIDDGKSTKRDTVKLFLITALILTLLLALISYLYANYLSSQVESQKSSLTNLDNNPNINTFDKNLLAMRDLSTKIKLINSVNGSRVYFSGMLLPLLEAVVESDKSSYVYFNNISLKKDSTNSVVSVNLSGVAQDYPTLSRQITDFKSGPLSNYFNNFKFLSFASEDNHVTFSVSFNVDVSLRSYLSFLKNKDIQINTSRSISGSLFKGNDTANVFSSSTESIASSTNMSTSSVKLKNN